MFKFGITFPVTSPLMQHICVVNAKTEEHARLYARTMFGHLFAGIYSEHEIDALVKRNRYEYLIETSSAETALANLARDGKISYDDLPESITENI